MFTIVIYPTLPVDALDLDAINADLMIDGLPECDQDEQDDRITLRCEEAPDRSALNTIECLEWVERVTASIDLDDEAREWSEALAGCYDTASLHRVLCRAQERIDAINDALRGRADTVRAEDLGIDVTALPVWGDDPADIHSYGTVWSWDASSVLEGAGDYDEWSVVPRTDC